MCNMIAVVLLGFVAQVCAQESGANHMDDGSMDKFANEFVNKLFDRVIEVTSLHRADLDETTFGKAGRLATTPSKSLRSLAFPAAPKTFSASGDFASPLVDYQQQFMPQIMLCRGKLQAGTRVSSHGGSSSGDSGCDPTTFGRRALLTGLASVGGSLVLPPEGAHALQGYTPGRIPGVKPSDVPGYQQYRRPEGKQGGHGVGWSEIPPYSFLVPDDWEEIPVSIADLGGTELDLRFKNAAEGDLAVVCAPILRFLDVGYNSNVKIDQIGSPQKLIEGFGPELIGTPVDEDMVESARKRDGPGGLPYYDFELDGHVLVSMTAFKNRVFIMTVKPKGPTSWRLNEKRLRKIVDTFEVDANFT